MTSHNATECVYAQFRHLRHKVHIKLSILHLCSPLHTIRTHMHTHTRITLKASRSELKHILDMARKCVFIEAFFTHVNGSLTALLGSDQFDRVDLSPREK